jgi:hypothetical protein
LTEAECYARCYPGGGDVVRVIKVGRTAGAVSGEEVRRSFETRLRRRRRAA